MSKRTMQPAGHEMAQIRRARAGEPDALEALWRANRRWVAAIVLAHRPRNVDAEDLMQEVALKFVDKVDTLRDEGSFRPWLRQIAVNACRGAARRSRPTIRLAQGERPESGEVSLPSDPAAIEAKHVEHHDSAEHLYNHLMTLPSEYREPLLMRCIQEMTYQQISEVLGLPVTTIETRLARARRMLRQELLNGQEIRGNVGADE